MSRRKPIVPPSTGPMTDPPPPSVPYLLAPPAQVERIRQELRIPLRPDAEAILYVPFNMTEGDWEQFMTVLTAMKPGIVREAVRDGAP